MRLANCRCLRRLLLVMCRHPFAKKALTLHLARSEGRERYCGCNLVHRKVLVSSHQHLMTEAPRKRPSLSSTLKRWSSCARWATFSSALEPYWSRIVSAGYETIRVGIRVPKRDRQRAAARREVHDVVAGIELAGDAKKGCRLDEHRIAFTRRPANPARHRRGDRDRARLADDQRPAHVGGFHRAGRHSSEGGVHRATGRKSPHRVAKGGASGPQERRTWKPPVTPSTRTRKLHAPLWAASTIQNGL